MSPREHLPGSAERARERRPITANQERVWPKHLSYEGLENIPFVCPLKATGHVLSSFCFPLFFVYNCFVLMGEGGRPQLRAPLSGSCYHNRDGHLRFRTLLAQHKMHCREAFPLGTIFWLKGIHYLFKFRCIEGFEIKTFCFFPASFHLLLVFACSVLRHSFLGSRPGLSRLGGVQLVWGCPRPARACFLQALKASQQSSRKAPAQMPAIHAFLVRLVLLSAASLRSPWRIFLLMPQDTMLPFPGVWLPGTLLHLFIVLLIFSAPSHLAVTSSGLLLGGSTEMLSPGVRCHPEVIGPCGITLTTWPHQHSQPASTTYH